MSLRSHSGAGGWEMEGNWIADKQNKEKEVNKKDVQMDPFH